LDHLRSRNRDFAIELFGLSVDRKGLHRYLRVYSWFGFTDSERVAFGIFSIILVFCTAFYVARVHY
jgi:hypothetical protein